LRSPSSRYVCALVISARQSELFFNGLLGGFSQLTGRRCSS
jgi:hypothetical protein